MNKENLKEYAELKIQEKRIKGRIEELNPLIKQEMIDLGLDKVPTTAGNFNIKKGKKWTYSSAVTRVKEMLDSLQDREEANGTATFVEVEQLEFRELKNESDS